MHVPRFLTRPAIAALLACGVFAPRLASAAEPESQPDVARVRTLILAPQAEVRYFNIVDDGGEVAPAQVEAAPKPNDTIIIQRLENGKLDPATMEKLQAILRQRQAGANEAFRIETVPQTFWLGVECRVIDPALRKQLKLEGEAGIVVGRVMENSPAAKAGIVEGDILLSYTLLPDNVNLENELKSVEQLIDVVQQSGGGTLRLAVRRDGGVKILEVEPERRTADQYDPAAMKRALATQGKANAAEEAEHVQKHIAEWQRQMRAQGFAVPAAPLGTGTLDIVRPAPGFVLPHPLKPAKVKWPDDLSVSVQRTGNSPAKITVRHGEKLLTVEEQDLPKLPPEVRMFVEELLGRGPMTLNVSRFEAVPGAPIRFSVTLPDDAYLAKPVRPVQPTEVAPAQGLHKVVIGKHEHGGFEGGQMSELQALQLQLQAMQKQLDAIQQQTQAREQPKEKVRKEKEPAPENKNDLKEDSEE